MFTSSIRASAAAVLFVVTEATASYIRPPLTGHDFEFTAVYKSSLTISTSDPPKDVLSAKEIALQAPAVTLTDPDSAGREDRYLSFLEISYIPTIDGLDDVIYTFPWIKTNLVVKENGTLSDELDESSSITRFDKIESNEVRNATLHVWKQTDALMAFLDDDNMPLFWQLALVWSNTTSRYDYNFQHANVDFKVRNETGNFRGGVDENGDGVPGYISSSTSMTSATALPTDAPSTTAGSGSVPASTTTSTESPTATPNAAPSQVILSAPWSMMSSGLLLLSPVILAIL
ncbi:hypothetical protein F4819DRAFT_231280 [Hypoxylon fuscum]|nr:hypothetical protein F4819DRAFT_231280 [Hypoxylon fuscum]